MSDTYKLSKSNYLKFNNKYILGGGKSNLDHKYLAQEYFHLHAFLKTK
jgi:hypothetical protein